MTIRSDQLVDELRNLRYENAKLRELLEAVKLWLFCPEVGGYKDGPSHNDTCIALTKALIVCLGIDPYSAPPSTEQWTVEKMEQFIAAAREDST